MKLQVSTMMFDHMSDQRRDIRKLPVAELVNLVTQFVMTFHGVKYLSSESFKKQKPFCYYKNLITVITRQTGRIFNARIRNWEIYIYLWEKFIYSPDPFSCQLS